MVGCWFYNYWIFNNKDVSNYHSVWIIAEKSFVSTLGEKINVNSIPAKDAYKFCLCLLDVLFIKEELHDHLLLPSKKSEKPPLDKHHVNLMFDLIDKRFGKKWDLSEVYVLRMA